MDSKKSNTFLKKFLGFFKKFPTIIALAIGMPLLIYAVRYIFLDENYYYNSYYYGQETEIYAEQFRITKINKVTTVYQAASMFSYQGGACVNDYYIICTDNFEAIIIYDTNHMGKGPIHIIKTGIVNTDWHCNQIFFSNTYYSTHDKFPLMYVSMESPKVHSTIAFRIYQLGGEYRVQQIQSICLEFDQDEDKIYYPNSYYDHETGMMYYAGYTNNSYMKEEGNFIKFYKFALPDYRTPEELIYTSSAISSFSLPSETATQGGFILDGYLYQTFSFNSKTDPLKAPKMRVVDLEKEEIIHDYQNLYADFGVAEEFEHVAISDNGRMYSLGNPFNIYEFEYEDSLL